jgi:hypothetical protein
MNKICYLIRYFYINAYEEAGGGDDVRERENIGGGGDIVVIDISYGITTILSTSENLLSSYILLIVFMLELWRCRHFHFTDWTRVVIM